MDCQKLSNITLNDLQLELQSKQGYLQILQQEVIDLKLTIELLKVEQSKLEGN